MLHPRRSIANVRRIAEAVASAPELETAFDRLATELSRALHTRSCVLRRSERGWMLVSQSRGGMRVSLSDLVRAVDTVPSDDPIACIDLGIIAEGPWTSMTLELPDEPARVLLAGDWTQFGMLNALGALLSLALRSVHEHQARRRAERLAIGGYAMARRLSRFGGVDIVCRRIVQQVARSLNAGRVTLALYRSEEDRLTIAATHGHSLASPEDVR